VGLAGLVAGLFAILAVSRFQLRFKDRVAAAHILANILESRFNHTTINKNGSNKRDIIVLGIPRGGVVIADVVARKLSADFDIIISKKIGSPDNKEDAIGAVTEDGTTYIDQQIVKRLKISRNYIEKEKSYQMEEIKRTLEIYSNSKEAERHCKIIGNTVILVDDGAATGATLITTARWIRKQKPKGLIISVPIAPRQTADLLKNEADAVEVITSPYCSNFISVEQFYQDFSPVTDDQVIEIMMNRGSYL
jgi:putative phosphoribosyl transferase